MNKNKFVERFNNEAPAITEKVDQLAKEMADLPLFTGNDQTASQSISYQLFSQGRFYEPIEEWVEEVANVSGAEQENVEKLLDVVWVAAFIKLGRKDVADELLLIGKRGL